MAGTVPLGRKLRFPGRDQSSGCRHATGSNGSWLCGAHRVYLCLGLCFLFVWRLCFLPGKTQAPAQVIPPGTGWFAQFHFFLSLLGGGQSFSGPEGLTREVLVMCHSSQGPLMYFLLLKSTAGENPSFRSCLLSLPRPLGFLPP